MIQWRDTKWGPGRDGVGNCCSSFTELARQDNLVQRWACGVRGGKALRRKGRLYGHSWRCAIRCGEARQNSGMCVCFTLIFLVIQFLWAVLDKGLQSMGVRSKEGLERESSPRNKVKGLLSVDFYNSCCLSQRVLCLFSFCLFQPFRKNLQYIEDCPLACFFFFLLVLDIIPSVSHSAMNTSVLMCSRL